MRVLVTYHALKQGRTCSHGTSCGDAEVAGATSSRARGGLCSMAEHAEMVAAPKPCSSTSSESRGDEREPVAELALPFERLDGLEAACGLAVSSSWAQLRIDALRKAKSRASSGMNRSAALASLDITENLAEVANK